jgi:prepilin-type N-terminal cleavage/methylation domain-containing protein
MAMRKQYCGFTLVEIMIVVAIIGMLAAIAIPSLMKSRNTSREKACINNLRQIDGAKERWAMENNLETGDPSVDADVDAYMSRGRPVCPAGGTYTYQNVGTTPTCTVAGHTF